MSRDLSTLLSVAERAARAGGEVALPGFGIAATQHQKSERPQDMVTSFDVAAEKTITDILRAHDPSIAIVGEESGGAWGDGLSWLVDPIDGTGHFVRGNPWTTTLIALVENGTVLVGVVYDFVSGDMYSAVRGSGATRNGEPLRVSDGPTANPFVVCDFDLTIPGNVALIPKVGQTAAVTSIWACGYTYVMIATGRFDGIFVQQQAKGAAWDHAAGTLLVEEAGCVVTNRDGSPYDCRTFDYIAATPAVHENLMAIA